MWSGGPDVFLMAYAVVMIGLAMSVLGKVLLRDDEDRPSADR